MVVSAGRGSTGNVVFIAGPSMVENFRSHEGHQCSMESTGSRWTDYECLDCEVTVIVRRPAVPHLGPDAIDDSDTDLHVLPEFPGEREHQTSIDCWCRPKRDEQNHRLVVHERRAEA